MWITDFYILKIYLWDEGWAGNSAKNSGDSSQENLSIKPFPVKFRFLSVSKSVFWYIFEFLYRYSPNWKFITKSLLYFIHSLLYIMRRNLNSRLLCIENLFVGWGINRKFCKKFRRFLSRELINQTISR